MRFYADMTYMEISEELGVNINTIKSRARSVKEKLKKEVLLYEEKHDVNLHTPDLFDNLGDMISEAARNTKVPENLYDTLSGGLDSYTSAANTASTLGNSMSSGITSGMGSGMSSAAANGITNSLSTVLANAFSNKLSWSISAIAVAVCAITIIVPKGTDSKPRIPAEPSVPTAESPNQHTLPDSDTSEFPESSSETTALTSETVREVIRVSEAEPIVETNTIVIPVETVRTVENKQTSTVYLPGETSIITEIETSYITQTEYLENSDIPDSEKDSAHEDIDYQDYQVRVYYNNNEATLLKYNGKEIDIVMPSYIEYNGKEVPVTKIDRNTFTDYTVISIDPDTGEEIKSIEMIKSVTLPENLTEIPNSAFSHMKNLSSISSNKNVQKIGEFAFYETGFEELDFNELFPNLREVEDSAFAYCNNLKKVVLPENIIYMGQHAFGRSYSIEDVTITYKAEENNYYNAMIEFDCNEKLKNVHIKFSEKNISLSKSLENYLLVNGIENLYLELEEDDAEFSGNVGDILYSNQIVNNLYLPEGMKIIHSQEFYNYSFGCSTENIYIPASVELIEGDAFYDIQSYHLQNIFVSENNPNYYSIDGVLFDKKTNELICFPTHNTIDLENNGKYFSSFDDIKYKAEKVRIGSKTSDISELYECFPYTVNIEVDEENPYFTEKDGVIYSKDGKELIYYPIRRTDNQLNIAEGCERIAKSPYCDFYNEYPQYKDNWPCGIFSVSIPESFEKLVRGQFSTCVHLEQVFIYSEDIEIENYALGFAADYDEREQKSLTRTDNFTIVGYADSTAQKYAEKYHFNFMTFDEYYEEENEHDEEYDEDEEEMLEETEELWYLY